MSVYLIGAVGVAGAAVMYYFMPRSTTESPSADKKELCEGCESVARPSSQKELQDLFAKGGKCVVCVLPALEHQPQALLNPMPPLRCTDLQTSVQHGEAVATPTSLRQLSAMRSSRARPHLPSATLMCLDVAVLSSARATCPPPFWSRTVCWSTG